MIVLFTLVAHHQHDDFRRTDDLVQRDIPGASERDDQFALCWVLRRFAEAERRDDLSAAPWALLGTTQRIDRTITVLELDSNGDVRIETYGGAAFDRPVPRATLPPKITAHGATLVQDDLAIPAPPGAVGSKTR